MHRIAYLIITIPEGRAQALPRQTLALLKAQGIETCAVLPAGMPHLPEADRCIHGTPGAVTADVQSRPDKPGEVWIFSDDLFGPVCSLEALTAPSDTAWFLARGAGFYALPGTQAALPAVKAWLDDGMTEEGFLALGLDAVEKIDTADRTAATAQPMLDEPHRMIREKHCPFLRHEIFHRPYDEVISLTLGHMAQETYQELTHRLAFDVSPLWAFLTAACHQEDLFWNMKLQRTLSTTFHDEDGVNGYLQTHRLGLGMHLYYPDLFEQSYQYACSFPPETDVFITTSDDRRKAELERIFAKLPVRSLTVRVIGNRGRDVSALLIGMRELMDYDCVCFFHDKKVMQVRPRSIGVGFAFTTAENLLGSPAYVRNVIDLFRNEPQLGIASPTPPNHGDYYFTMGSTWGPNYDITRALYDRMGLTVPMAADKMPLAPLGTCFWFRGKALAPLFALPWTYEDFPPEPNNFDCTLLHAIERLYPYVAVEAGYFPIYIYSDRYAAMQYTHFRHYIRGYQQALVKHGIMNKQPVMRDMAAQRLKAKKEANQP